MFEPFQRLKSGTVVLRQANIDTDQIIPARFLTTTSREGLGENAFYDWRYDDAGAPREQVGNTEVLSAWDRYRGGLEHMLGLALAHGGMRAPDRVRQQMETMVVDRQLVALRLRLIAGRDPLESYYLATRLRGLGRVTDLPLPLDQIRLAAAVRYVTSELPQMTGADRLVVLGECPAETLANLVRGADRPVEQITDESDLKPSDALLVLGEASEDHLASLETRCAAAMSEAELFRKFP